MPWADAFPSQWSNWEPRPYPHVSRPLDTPVLWLLGPGTSGTFVRNTPPFCLAHSELLSGMEVPPILTLQAGLLPLGGAPTAPSSLLPRISSSSRRPPAPLGPLGLPRTSLEYRTRPGRVSQGGAGLEESGDTNKEGGWGGRGHPGQRGQHRPRHEQACGVGS